jgi:phage baseplate assembly protein W
MSLRIQDFDGVNLIEQPPEQVRLAAPPVIGGRATVQCLVIEEGTLPYDYVTGTLNWNDGSLPVVYNGTSAGTVTIDAYRNLQPGDYTVTVEAHNYAPPVWNTVSVNFAFEVRPLNMPPDKVPIIYGPILPKDAGFPNPDQWNWNRGEDIEILASSVKMLLTTAKGERIMTPEYGTNLRLILFELQTTGIEGLVQQEIVDALVKWEPRVTLQFLSVEKTGDREVTVNASFVSKLNQRDFNIPMVFSP